MKSSHTILRTLFFALFIVIAAHTGTAAPDDKKDTPSLLQALGKMMSTSGVLPDEEITTHAKLVATGDNIELYSHNTEVSAEFLNKLENAFKNVGSVTAITYDNKTLGPKLRVYISSAVRISHVWHGYEHQKDPRGLVFLNVRVYQGAMQDRDATYIHEITHLFTWRYASHSLREGFADYVALRILPNASIGPIPARIDGIKIPRQLADHLGTTKPPPREIISDLKSRQTYYLGCRRLVSFLIDQKGIRTFLELYASPQPGKDLERLYGITREEAVRQALKNEVE